MRWLEEVRTLGTVACPKMVHTCEELDCCDNIQAGKQTLQKKIV
jgi:hypothetical protein